MHLLLVNVLFTAKNVIFTGTEVTIDTLDGWNAVIVQVLKDGVGFNNIQLKDVSGSGSSWSLSRSRSREFSSSSAFVLMAAGLEMLLSRVDLLLSPYSDTSPSSELATDTTEMERRERNELLLLALTGLRSRLRLRRTKCSSSSDQACARSS